LSSDLRRKKIPEPETNYEYKSNEISVVRASMYWRQPIGSLGIEQSDGFQF